ncbi:MAG TPA: SAF domain-containing protein [Dietzia timorensis]|uniref:SAF domain-containing protein n=1 Tax=Dietzia timorensis TaxID=499555 RepID=A0A921F3Q6_9ACTN|nr:SAF domain-containing protein [Dietzia timorensis]HJE90865.1 SAF domain-containing protein [Dietzia timorensis]
MPTSGSVRTPGSGRGNFERSSTPRPGALSASPVGSLDSWRSRRRLRSIGAVLLVLLAAALFVRDRLDTATVLVAAADLGEGHPLVPADVREVEAPGSLVPASALLSWTEIEERVLASAMGEGEILTASRLDVPEERGSDEVRTVSIPVPDKGTLAMLHPGAVVDIFSSTPGPGGEANQAIATGAKVKEVPRDSRGESAGTVAIQVPTGDAPAVAAAAVESPVILVLVE